MYLFVLNCSRNIREMDEHDESILSNLEGRPPRRKQTKKRDLQKE